MAGSIPVGWTTAEVEILDGFPPSERARRLLWFSWRLGQRMTRQLGDSTADGFGCGDGVVLLAGMVRRTGLTARHVGLYNVPGQGNHSLLEVETPAGERYLLDPTFGVFFSPGGDPLACPLDPERVTGYPQPERLVEICCQAVIPDPERSADLQEIRRVALAAPLTELFAGGRFDGEYFRVEDYARAERVAVDDEDALLPLAIPLMIRRGHGQFGVPENLSPGSRETLLYQRLNRRLVDEDRRDDVSLVATRFGVHGRRSMPFLRIMGLVTGRSYSLTLHIYNPGEEFRLDLLPLENGVACYPSLPHRIAGEAEVQKLVIGLRARREDARLILHVMDPASPTARLFAVEIDETELE